MKLFASLFLVIALISSSCSQNNKEKDLQYTGNVTAPDFPKGAEWLNTGNPVSLKDLRGKLVLLDFWTYCCINCMHIIPDLKKLEEKYSKELVIIGVHSAKFLNERGTDNIRSAILRYEIEHPVINDKDFEVWNSYHASAWPTVVLIDPQGKIIKSETGEGVFNKFDPVISSAISEYDAEGLKLNREPITFELEKNKTPKSLLSYPGKIAADENTSRLFVTDSDNNRVLILKTNEAGDEALIEEVIGSGAKGKKDGSYSEAEFFHPQGIAFHGGLLYVADTENHLIREINLNTKQVKTIAGLGYQSDDHGIVSGKANETALNSPWDLIYLEDALYIAMAGTHQLWKFNLSDNTIGTYAGSGRENIHDDELLASALAQPSGITTNGLKLFFADSEVSAVRIADLNKNGKINTIVGSGLFEFGDIDGKGGNVRLQHPLGIVYNPADNLLYVADTYNSKIKTVNPVTKESSTYAGTGTAGTRNGSIDAQFNEPGGLTIMNGKLFVTDTNNHLIRVIDMKTKITGTVKITNPDKLMTKVKSDMKKKDIPAVILKHADVKTGTVNIKFNFRLPERYHINQDAVPQFSIYSDDGKIAAASEMELSVKEPVFEVPVQINEGSGNINIELIIYYCNTENEGICKFRDILFKLPVTASRTGAADVSINYTLN